MPILGCLMETKPANQISLRIADGLKEADVGLLQCPACHGMSFAVLAYDNGKIAGLTCRGCEQPLRIRMGQLVGRRARPRPIPADPAP